MHPLKLGIVGCGRVTTSHHLPSLRAIEDIEVVAIADAQADRVEEVATRFGIGERFTDASRMIGSMELDAVAVCVPPEHHAALGEAALNAGAHLFLEKPVATSLADGERLRVAAEAAGRAVLVGLNFRHHRLVQAARRILSEGAIGAVEMIRSAHTSGIRNRGSLPDWWADRDRGGGVLFEVATHHYDLWRHLLEDDVATVWATSTSGEDHDDTGVVAAQTRGGVRISGAFSCRTFDDSQVEVFGRKGRLRLSLYRFDGLSVEPFGEFPGGAASRQRALLGTLRELPRGLARMRHGGDYLLSWESQWRHFVDVVRGRCSASASLTDGLAALHVAAAARESLQTGEAITIAP